MPKRSLIRINYAILKIEGVVEIGAQCQEDRNTYI